MIDPSSCVRYTLREDVNSAGQKLITWLSDHYPDIFLIHQESYNDQIQRAIRQTLIHRHWGATFIIEIVSLRPGQTLILIPTPPDPSLEDVSRYEDTILELLPDSSISIRLARVDGNVEKALSVIRTLLREQRHHVWMQIQVGLIHSLQLEFFEGDYKELLRDIPKDENTKDPIVISPSQEDRSLLDLWVKGHTAKQIALRMGRTEKTILNRLTLMRKTYGEQLVPRRRMA